MTSISHEPTRQVQETPHWVDVLKTPELWASLAIITMWVSVLFAAVYGPDFVSTSAGGNSTTIPSAIAVALFAFLGTWVLARFGFRHDRD
jgi:uncharacterized membrane protein (DUF485 family)